MTVNLSRRVCKKIQYTLPIGPKRLSSSQVLIKRVLQEQKFLQFAGPEHSVCFNTIRKTKELSNHL